MLEWLGSTCDNVGFAQLFFVLIFFNFFTIKSFCEIRFWIAIPKNPKKQKTDAEMLDTACILYAS